MKVLWKMLNRFIHFDLHVKRCENNKWSDLFQDFGEHDMSPWVRSYSLTHHFTHKLMANQNGQYRPPKICYILVCQTSKYSVMNTCHFTNSHTIIAATRASEWHLLKHCMAEDTGLQFVVGVLSFRGPTIVGETSDKIGLIHERLKVARSRQKSNPDTHRREL